MMGGVLGDGVWGDRRSDGVMGGVLADGGVWGDGGVCGDGGVWGDRRSEG